MKDVCVEISYIQIYEFKLKKIIINVFQSIIM